MSSEKDFKIPLFDLNIGREEEEALINTLRSGWISMGPNVKKAEQAFKNMLSVRHAVAVTNGTASLHLALKVLGIKEGDEVIVPSLTFVATANAVRYVGATPVFADIVGPDDFSIDPVEVKRRITPRTRAVMVMHYGGFSCPMDRIMEIAREHGLFVVEDAAHAPLSEHAGTKLGTIGDVGCFSFYSNKNITCSEGGMLVTNSRELAEKAGLLRSHGMTSLSYDRARGHASEYDVVDLGYNYRMDDIRGALLVVQLKRLGSDLKRRERLRSVYVEKLAGTDEIIIPYLDHPHRSSNYIFPVLLKEGGPGRRDNIRRKLAEKGIQTSVHYPPVHRFSIYRDFSTLLPRTEHAADNEITLPLYFGLEEKNVERICRELSEILNDNLDAKIFSR
jgi:dTDP-4-amino-4,6-dideoxygalactose transaminase